jgi:hypothetical protein
MMIVQIGGLRLCCCWQRKLLRTETRKRSASRAIKLFQLGQTPGIYSLALSSFAGLLGSNDGRFRFISLSDARFVVIYEEGLVVVRSSKTSGQIRELTYSI